MCSNLLIMPLLPEMDSETKPEPMLQMPQNEEVQAIDLRRAVENAEEQLNKTKGTFAEKIGRLKRR